MEKKIKSNLSVLHICTFDTGGAANAALRLHKGLLQQGVQSKFVCLRKTLNEPELYEYNKRKKLNFIGKILNKLGYSLLNELRDQKLISHYSGEYEIFTFPQTDIDLLKSQLVQDADIIQLHWVSYLLDYSTFFKGINKPVIWTLHDKNPIMGGFHLQLDKIKNPKFSKLEERLKNQKTKWINRIKDLTIVSPSKSLLKYSIDSKTFNSFPHFNINNGVDTFIFNFHNKITARKRFGLPLEGKLVLFVNSAYYHKGSDMVIECIEHTNFENLHFISLGKENLINSPSVVYIESLEDEQLLSVLFSAADLFVLPSREDNLPNMMLESLSCGTPVLGTPIGGIPEVIENDFNGMISKETNWLSIQNILIDFDNGIYNFDREAIRESAIQRFSLTTLTENYMKLYNSKLAN